MKTIVSAAVGFCLVLVLSLVSEPLVKDAAAQTEDAQNWFDHLDDRSDSADHVGDD
ncbi:MAG: hypothetical protein ABSH25_08730 [Syntrophorhabdales bacterium]